MKFINCLNCLTSKTACLTGHRPNKLPWFYDENNILCSNFKKDLYCILQKEIQKGITNFLTGMAEGFDMIATEILLDLRKTYNKNIKIFAIIPCLGQESRWKIPQQLRYQNIINKCDGVIILSKSYTPNCMNERNKFLVDHCSTVIACYNGHNGGTKNTINYAKYNNRIIKIINPNNYNGYI